MPTINKTTMWSVAAGVLIATLGPALVTWVVAQVKSRL